MTTYLIFVLFYIIAVFETMVFSAKYRYPHNFSPILTALKCQSTLYLLYSRQVEASLSLKINRVSKAYESFFHGGKIRQRSGEIRGNGFE
jgi:hypothetical protein